MENKEPITLETTSVVPGDFEMYVSPDGNTYTIGAHDLDFFQKLQKLPVSVKIAMMRITEDQLRDYLFAREMEYREKLLLYFKQKWFWKVDDEPVKFDDPYNNENYFGISKNEKQIKAAIKNGKLTTIQKEKIEKFFDGVNSEVTLKN